MTTRTSELSSRGPELIVAQNRHSYCRRSRALVSYLLGIGANQSAGISIPVRRLLECVHFWTVAGAIGAPARCVPRRARLGHYSPVVKRLLFKLEKTRRREQMSDKASLAPRFLVRQGSQRWMVYDRQRKGPAMLGTAPAVNLTKEQAERIQRSLMVEQNGS
jgi:hypothetical protein